MNLKKKLTSMLSLVLALTMLFSSAAMATDLTGQGQSSASSSSNEPVEPVEPTPTDSDEPTEPTEPTDPTEPTEPSDPTTPADPTTDTSNDPTPAAMTSAKGWDVDESGNWIYTYTDLDGNVVTAGDKELYPTGKVQVLYVPEQECTVNGAAVTRTAGFYAFSNGVWAKGHTASQVTYAIVEVELRQDGAAHQLESKYVQFSGNRIMTFKVTDGESRGELFNGTRTEVCKAEKNKKLKRRYDNGQPRKGFGLGTDGKLYYYSDGFYQTAASLKQLKKSSGYHLFEDKLYYANATSLKKYNGVVFTGRWTNSADGVKRRYEKGVPFTGFGLGTQSTPCLYYYVDGLFQKTKDKHGNVVYDGTKSREELEAYLGEGKVWTDKKLYVATEATLSGTKTQPYATPLTGYRMVDGKMYKYTKGTGVLFTGVYSGTEANLQEYKGSYFSKGVKTNLPDGWRTSGGKRYYVKNGAPLVGWHYVKCNGRTYYYYFDKDGAQVQDLFAHFGSSYKSKKMTLRVNRYHHTTDFLLYNSKTKKYDIPAKSVVTSTPTESKHFPTGTYKLSYTRRWWSFVTTNSKGVKSTGYYQYATRVAGSPAALIHSSRYSAKKASALVVGNYNKLGTNQSYYCIRMQCGNSKLAYDCAKKQGSGKVKCVFTNEKTLGPNGKVTLANTTGKVKKGTKYDPTDPARK